ncbi:MAG: site-specific DNA-methyltransferase [Pseudoxanthomonas sp.]|jgi:adenine-specific DNA-methyltransferase|nr:site-specific DNA-methyltransferase [Pseudoxanthomonas sp.]
MAKKPTTSKLVTDLTHGDAKRKNIPTVEHQSVMQHHEQAPIKVKYPRGGNGLDDEKAQRNPDLDPQLVWRGKDQQDWSDLVVNAPPLYIQEKVKPKVLIDDLRRMSEQAAPQTGTLDMFGDFNGLPEGVDKTEFYQHEGHWQNRMILGDSLQVMASLAEREGLRGKVQCIYFDPPYGIKFNSNFQWSTTSRDVKDGNADHITREPEQVKAFRDTWKDGIHSYLTYLRDRLLVARDLLSASGSIFIQIGDENVHRVRALLDEVFGDENFIAEITVQKAGSTFAEYLGGVADYLLWFARDKGRLKYRPLFDDRQLTADDTGRFSLVRDVDGSLIAKSAFKGGLRPDNLVAPDPLQSASAGRDKGEGAASWFPVSLGGKTYRPTLQSRWKTNEDGMDRLRKANRLIPLATSIRYARSFNDFSVQTRTNIWNDLSGATDKIYVVQTTTTIVQRCLLMTTDPGDLVLDPTCGSGTTAYVAEQWGRRWITIDTSRVALALARARIMGARYPFYLLADSKEGQQKEAEVTRSVPSTHAVYGNIVHGFVYERVPHITLKSIANNAEIDVIWDNFQQKLEPLREALNKALDKQWQEWEIPREADGKWSDAAKKAHAEWWQQRIARQKEIDASIAAKAEFEFLYDKPYEDKKKVRVAGPFTVESLSPHRVLGVDDEDNLIDHVGDDRADYGQDFTSMILANLKTAGVQQAHKADKIEFESLEPWPGDLVCAEGRYLEKGTSKRAGILIGPEFGTVSRADLVDAAREAGDAGFDVLIACAFNYDAPASEFSKLGRINVLKARMNADLHMAEDLKNTGKGNLFVIFGEPDVDVLDTNGRSIRKYDGKKDVIEVPAGEELVVRINGVDVFHPSTGEVRSDGADGIACWFLDTDYNEESFFVRHAYFLGANDPYKALKTTLKAEIDEAAWASLNSDTSRPFPRPSTGRFAVKVINHLGDEVMKVFKVT